MTFFALVSIWIIFYFLHRLFTRSTLTIGPSMANRTARFIICPSCNGATSVNNGNSICPNCRTRL